MSSQTGSLCLASRTGPRLGSTGLSSHVEEEEKVSRTIWSASPRGPERVGHLPEVTQPPRAEPGLGPRASESRAYVLLKEGPMFGQLAVHRALRIPLPQPPAQGTLRRGQAGAQGRHC